MKMWICRTESGHLSLFDHEPEYNEAMDMWGIRWLGHEDDVDLGYGISNKNFPEVTFENSPMEVELVIKKKERA